MVQNKKHNRSIVLAARPNGAPVFDDFRMVNTPVKIGDRPRFLFFKSNSCCQYFYIVSP